MLLFFSPLIASSSILSQVLDLISLKFFPFQYPLLGPDLFSLSFFPPSKFPLTNPLLSFLLQNVKDDTSLILLDLFYRNYETE